LKANRKQLIVAAIGAASPIILQPFGDPSEVEQLVHAIILYIVL
jgi:hypothetical protein